MKKSIIASIHKAEAALDKAKNSRLQSQARVQTMPFSHGKRLDNARAVHSDNLNKELNELVGIRNLKSNIGSPIDYENSRIDELKQLKNEPSGIQDTY